jgi:hypothetical protein
MALQFPKTTQILRSIWNNSPLFNGLLLLIFFSFGLLGIFNHAMWRDELNGWLIARDSNFPIEFMQNIRYEGHPILWYLCLYFLNQLTSNPVTMQLFHLLLATASIYLFINFSPFSKLQKILFCFGYLPFYEYLLISRNYALGMLFAFIYCSRFGSRKKSYITLALILALMANSNAYSLCISIALCLTLILEYSFQHRFDIKLNASLKNCLLSLSIYLVGVTISVIMLLPPPDSTLQGGAAQWMLQFDTIQLTRTLSRIWNSYILIVLPGDAQPVSLWLFAILSLGLFVFATSSFIKKPVVLFFYLVSSLEILLFTYVKFLGSPRHYGHLYIILIISYWLASYYSPSDLLKQLPIKLSPYWLKIGERWLRFVSRQQMAFLTLILYTQLAAGIFAYSRDVILPYSASRATARYIQSQQLDKMFIAGSEDFAIAPLTAYLNRKIYYLESDSLGSFVLFAKQRETLDEAKILTKVRQIIQQEKQGILLILNHKLETSTTKDLTISFLAQFTHAFIDSEKYYLYLVREGGTRNGILDQSSRVNGEAYGLRRIS